MGSAHNILTAQALLLAVILRATAGPGKTHLFLGTVCVRAGRLKAKWCRIMGPCVSAGARDDSKKETCLLLSLSDFGSKSTLTAWFTVYEALGLAHDPLPKAAVEEACG